MKTTFILRLTIIICALSLFCAGFAQGIGLGVSPPLVELDKGVGRMLLFNPSEQPILVTIELEGEEGDMNARPRSVYIDGLKAQQVMIWGNGNGLARIFAENQETGGAFPLIQVRIHGDDEVDYKSFPNHMVWFLWAILAALLIFMTVYAMRVIRKRLKHVCYF